MDDMVIRGFAIPSDLHKTRNNEQKIIGGLVGVVERG